MNMIRLIGDKLRQWETGRKIEFEVSDEYTVNEVHFAKRDDTEALVVLPDGNAVGIPNIHLQDSRPLLVWLVTTDDGTECVLENATFAIDARPKPTDYVYTETEVLRFEKLEKEIQNLATDVETNKGKISKINNEINYQVLVVRSPGYVELDRQKIVESLNISPTWAEYNSWSAAEQQVFFETFASVSDFLAWRSTAKYANLEDILNVVNSGTFHGDLGVMLREEYGDLKSGESRRLVLKTPLDGYTDIYYGTITKHLSFNNGLDKIDADDLLEFNGTSITTGYSVCLSEVSPYDVKIRWENPPMVPGVEYCTTEKWNGQDVYAMLIDYGALPNAKTKYSYFDQTMSEVISIDGIITIAYSSGKTMARNIHCLAGVDDVWVNHTGDSRYLAIKTTEDLTNRTAKVVIKYIK